MTGINKLKAKYLEFQQYKYPSIPDHARSYPSCVSQSGTTNGLTRCIILYLFCKGWWAVRVSSEGKQRNDTKQVTDILGKSKQIGSTTYIPSTTMAGTPDIIAAINGKLAGIEVKNSNTKDRMSAAQEKVKKLIELSKGHYLVASDLNQVIEVLEQVPDNTMKQEYWMVTNDKDL
jgi:Holliday junction resolvase